MQHLQHADAVPGKFRLLASHPRMKLEMACSRTESGLRLAAEKHGIYMAGGQDQLKGRIVRIGHMGWVDWADVAAGLYALERSIVDAGGYIGARNYLEQGLAVYRAALEVTPGTPVSCPAVR